MNKCSLLRIGAFLCASIVATNIASAGNVLNNSSFGTTPVFSAGGWTAHSTESWSMNQSTALVYPGDTDSLWMQGLYGNGGAPAHYNMYSYQTVACAPGSTFTANAYFSQYVADITGEGGDNGNSLDAGGPYYSSGLFGSDTSGEEDGWIEVMFLDGSDNVLADYKSAIITPSYEASLISSGAVVTNYSVFNVNTTTGTTNYDIYLAWLNCEVTNQYDVSTIGGYNANTDPTTESVTNTLGSGQNMIAPPGTKFVQYRLGLSQAQYESGADYWDNCSLNLVGGPGPSVIGNISPNGSHFFNISSTNFTFTVTSSASGGAPLPTNPTSGIAVMVNGQNQSANLQFSGSPTALNVTLPNITSNTLYSISIAVTNSAGLVSDASSSFDTFSSNYFIVDVEDYDFTNGLFIQNPIPTSTPNPNSYWGTAGTLGVDQSAVASVNDGGTSPTTYPNRTDYNVAFQQATDLQLPAYIAANNPAVYNVNLSYNIPGNWLNYTRDPYPSGNYLVYARISGGQGFGVEYLNIVTNGYETSAQVTNELGQFTLQNGTDWNAYMWIPLTDSYGNLALVNIPPGRQTLQLLSGGGENLIDFIFVPVTSGLPPVIANITPFSTQTVFVNAPSVTFKVTSLTSTLATNNIHTYFNGVSVPETFTGNGTNWSVSVPLSVPANQINQSYAISAVDNNGLSNSVSGTFDTFSQNNLMIEAGDFDFNGGQWIDNPIETATSASDTNSYYYYPGGNPVNTAEYGIDYTTTNVTTAETYLYRVDGNTPAVVSTAAGTEVTSDFLRNKFINTGQVPNEAIGMTNTDYDVGWWSPGTWLNYTRTFPTNTYLVWGRLATAAAYTDATMSLVTPATRGTSSQTTQRLGTFADPNANGFQSWHWIPLTDTNGQPMALSLGGVETLKVTAPSGSATGSLNSHFYMFVPIVVELSFTISITANAGTAVIHIPTQTGHSYTLQYTTSLNAPNWQTLGSSIHTVNNSLTAGARFYRVVAQ
jgi:hypothetical protein